MLGFFPEEKVEDLNKKDSRINPRVQFGNFYGKPGWKNRQWEADFKLREGTISEVEDFMRLKNWPNKNDS